MKKNAIVTGGTSNQFPAMAVLALNIADKCPSIADELIIFHDGIPKEEQKKVNQIFPTVFIKYENPFNEVDNFSNEVKYYFSSFLFCKYELLKLLDSYECVIWTDYDVLIKQDISELKIKGKFDCKFLPENLLAKKFHKSFYWNEECVKDLNTFDMFGDAICCGLFVLFDTLPNYHNLYEKCIQLTKKYANSLYLPEEAIYSIVLQQEKILYDKLEFSKYFVKPEEEKIDNSSIKILHAAGQPKFWNGRENTEWNKYYNTWFSKYNGCKFETEKKKRKITLKKIIKCLLPYGLVKIIIK